MLCARGLRSNITLIVSHSSWLVSLLLRSVENVAARAEAYLSCPSLSFAHFSHIFPLVFDSARGLCR